MNQIIRINTVNNKISTATIKYDELDDQYMYDYIKIVSQNNNDFYYEFDKNQLFIQSSDTSLIRDVLDEIDSRFSDIKIL